jgi:hypothetical protein
MTNINNVWCVERRRGEEMKVYLLIQMLYGDHEIIGVYSTYEKATVKAFSMYKELVDKDDWSLDIKEIEVDK